MPEISWGVLGNPLWTLCEAIRLSEQITPPDEPHFRVPKKAEAEEESRRSPKTILEVLQEAANYPLHEVVANPVCGMVLNAIEAGDLATVPKMSERKDTDLEYCAKLKVRPLEYLRWRASIPSAPPLPAELQRYLDAHSAPKRGKQHGNTEVNARKREEVLGAAVACLFAWPDECRSRNGKVSAEAIQRLITEKENLFWGRDGQVPLKPVTVLRTIREWIRKTRPTAKKNLPTAQ